MASGMFHFKPLSTFHEVGCIMRGPHERRNTDHIAPLQHTQEVSQRFREDIVTEPNVRDLMQSEVAASSKAAGLYLVPKVVE